MLLLILAINTGNYDDSEDLEIEFVFSSLALKGDRIKLFNIPHIYMYIYIFVKIDYNQLSKRVLSLLI